MISFNNNKYVVVNSGYTSRLVKDMDQLNDKISEWYDDDSKIVSIKDSVWGNGTYYFNDQINTANMVFKELEDKGIDTDGTITLSLEDSNNIGSALAFANILMEYYYCAFFDMSHMDEMIQIHTNQGNILYMSFDTESG